MKQLRLVFIALAGFLALSVYSFAAGVERKDVQVYSNYSAANTTVGYTSAYPTYGLRYKMLHVTGANMATNAAAGLSGTVTAQCGPTTTGPWVTCQSIGTTAVTTTADKILTWDDLSAYVRFAWTKTAGKVNAYFTLSSQ